MPKNLCSRSLPIFDNNFIDDLNYLLFINLTDQSVTYLVRIECESIKPINIRFFKVLKLNCMSLWYGLLMTLFSTPSNSNNFEMCLKNVLTQELCPNLLSTQISPRTSESLPDMAVNHYCATEFGENICLFYNLLIFVHY